MNYVGVDLGTTNSAICSFDGTEVRLYKSPDQQDVTPSAIFIDKRGNKYFGLRAYNSAARSPDNAALLFKRLMGSGTPVHLCALNMTMTPEECSAQILRVLFGYLPLEMRGDPQLGTVITVPAAFNQMQKDATMTAAQSAGLGRVALMQEPVAAVMSVMRTGRSDGVFMVYDLGGGTLDIAIAQCTAGRVSLLEHGGIAMCGGRDIDRRLVDQLVRPWLSENFRLPSDFADDPRYRPLLRTAAWAAERAKIDLSLQNETAISIPDTELGLRDLEGNDIYIDIALHRERLDELIGVQIDESIGSARETLERAGLRADDVDRIVFVGGPTQYRPLRDKVAIGLGIAPSTDVNPMTAVAEGAAVFAESVDWSSDSRGRKSSRGSISAGGGPLEIGFAFVARTPESKARIGASLRGRADEGAAFQVDSLDSGWSSGRVLLEDGAQVDVVLAKPGDNAFKIFVFDGSGGPISLQQDKITIARTAASVDAIPASHSVFVEALERIGGQPVIDYLVRAGDALPSKGSKRYKAATALRAGGAGSIMFKLWEGDIADPIHDNRPIGTLRINGADFDDGTIAAGDDLICDYEVLDSGNIRLEVSVPSIGGSFRNGRNFYSRQEGQIDYTRSAQWIREQAEQMQRRIDKIAVQIDDPRLDEARIRFAPAIAMRNGETDPEISKQAMDGVHEARRLLALARRQHLPQMRWIELDKTVGFFESTVKPCARPSEIAAIDALVKTAQRAIERNGADFEAHLEDLTRRNFVILWRQDWFVINRFKYLSDAAHTFPDADAHLDLVAKGAEALKANDCGRLRAVVAEMDQRRFAAPSDEDLLGAVNIVRG
jgi:molecular chaperone DnaK